MKILSIEEIIIIAAQKREKLSSFYFDELKVIINENYKQAFKNHTAMLMGNDELCTHLYGMKIIWSTNLDSSQIIVGI